MERFEVDIWSDVVCPWCAIGYARFAEAVERVKGEYSVEARWMPFELNPDMPPEGRTQAAHLAKAFGREPEAFEAMQAQVLEAAKSAGFSMDYAGEGAPPEPMIWNTFDAHRLLRWALTEAGPEAQTRLKLALFRAHFQQRRNISDRDLLLDIAAGEGFDRAAASAALDDEALSIAVRTEERRAHENRISSVPTFVVNGRYILQGAAEPEAFANALMRIAAIEAQA